LVLQISSLWTKFRLRNSRQRKQCLLLLSLSKGIGSILKTWTRSLSQIYTQGSPKSRPLLEPNSDLNFQDIKDDSAFTFAQPNRMQSLKNTPQKENSSVHGSPKSSGIGLFRCLSSGSESIDDGFLEFLVDKEVT